MVEETQEDNRGKLELESGGRDRKVALLMIGNFMPVDTTPEEIHAQTCRLCAHFEGGTCSFSEACRRNSLFEPHSNFDEQSLIVIRDIRRRLAERRQLAA